MMTPDMDRLLTSPGRPEAAPIAGEPRLEPARRPGEPPTVVVPNANRLAAARAAAWGDAGATRPGRHGVPIPSARPAPPPPTASRPPEPRLARRLGPGALVGAA